MRKIIVPVDFSENALNAFKYAVELFKHGPVEFFLIHCYLTDPEKETDTDQELAEQTIRNLESVKKKIRAYSPNPKHTVKLLPVEGGLVESINDLVDSENADLVVMGTKGETADKHLTFGSNTLQVIKYIKCPVLAVPAFYKEIDLKNVLFSTDFMMPYQRRELKLLSDLARFYASTVHFMYVTGFTTLSAKQQINKSFLEAVFEQNQVNFVPGNKSDITSEVRAFVKENPMDLLVMINTRHSYLDNILYKSTIEKIGLNLEIPFLVLQNLPR